MINMVAKIYKLILLIYAIKIKCEDKMENRNRTGNINSKPTTNQFNAKDGLQESLKVCSIDDDKSNNGPQEDYVNKTYATLADDSVHIVTSCQGSIFGNKRVIFSPLSSSDEIIENGTELPSAHENVTIENSHTKPTQSQSGEISAPQFQILITNERTRTIVQERMQQTQNPLETPDSVLEDEATSASATQHLSTPMNLEASASPDRYPQAQIPPGNCRNVTVLNFFIERK